jgi:hypothetical protein
LIRNLPQLLPRQRNIFEWPKTPISCHVGPIW